ncbi:hypothetical protein [Streptomyces sp. NPDC055912]
MERHEIGQCPKCGRRTGWREALGIVSAVRLVYDVVKMLFL